MTTPPTVFYSTNDNKLGIQVQYIYDGGLSGYRSVEATDLATNISGDLVVNLEQLEGQISGIQSSLNNGVTTKPAKSPTVTGQQIYTTNGQIFAANPNRNLLYVQNLNTGTLYVSYSGSANQSNFSAILKASTSIDDGTAGVLTTDQITSTVNCSGSGPTTRFVAWEA